MQKHYELTFIVPAGADTDDNVQPTVDAVKALLVAKGADVYWEDTLGKRKLKYPIKHQTYGLYFTFEFDVEQDQTKEIEHELRLNTDILRCLLILKTKKTVEELQKDKEAREFYSSQAREEREGRDRRDRRKDDRKKDSARVNLEEVPVRKDAEPAEEPKEDVEPVPAEETTPEAVVEEPKEEVREETPVEEEVKVEEAPAPEVAEEPVEEPAPEPEVTPEPQPEAPKEEEKKVELKDFDSDKLDEILDKEIDI